jgi:hypothetical protein
MSAEQGRCENPASANLQVCNVVSREDEQIDYVVRTR